MRIALPFLLLLIAAAPAGAAAPQAKVRTTACLTGLAKESRAARFEADARAIPGALKMQIRFTLQARVADAPGWTAVDSPGFGSWNTSDPGIGRFVYVKTVENLLAPASFRAVVHFRWLGLAGRTLQRARRTSRSCRQPDLRPDLVPSRLERDGDGYSVAVTNTGRTPAEGFTVTLETAGQRYELGRVARLAAGGRTVVYGRAPECAAGETLTLRVDPDGKVQEADEDGNFLVLTCPGPVA